MAIHIKLALTIECTQVLLLILAHTHWLFCLVAVICTNHSNRTNL